MLPEESSHVYTAGASLREGRHDAASGSGIWYSANHPDNKSLRLPGAAQSQKTSEIAAVLLAAQSATGFVPLTIYTNSEYAINGLTTHLRTWEDKGWIGVPDSAYFRAAAYHLKRRSAPIDFKKVKNPTSATGTRAAAALATTAAASPLDDETIDLTIPPSFNLQGAKLSTIAQATAYQAIRERRAPHTRLGTEARLAETRLDLGNFTHRLETDATLWRACRSPDLRAPIQQFIFRALHRSQKVGEHWASIPGYQDRALCPACDNTTESLDHILFRCDDPTAATIWALAKSLWPHGQDNWPQDKLGIVLASGCLTTRSQLLPRQGPTPHTAPTPLRPSAPGASRLLRILISESAYLIWVLRCERVISETQHTATTTTTRWMRAINDRLHTDQLNASRLIRTSKAVTRAQRTWAGTLADEHQLPGDWPKSHEVLVGIRAPRTPT
ncbi:hypothetical protein BV25DRAFT_1800552 [Artomyces pyxidatus]|uniref:Uncharacterized protein n=1 Tax=Artomyces pyxidatus TaxID=48021 RepID=A0ACB8T688_9AGAM|nr:hypothetical protein BV25DRAFT_1800552 [Artomyces pyxidatus]